MQIAGSASLVSLGTGPVQAGDTRLIVDAHGDPSKTRAFADADLMALPQIEFSTSTIWTNSKVSYSGPSLAAVLEVSGAPDGALRMTAVNDYKVDMPRAQVEPNAPIIANRINGAPFSIREKGPLWLMFPFDSDERFQTEEVYSFSIWQLTGIQVINA